MERIILFGTGARAEKVIKSINFKKYNLLAVLDNNENKQGTFWHDVIVKSPNDLGKEEYDKIVICSTAYPVIYKQLVEECNVNPDKIVNHVYFIKNKLLDYYKIRKYDDEIKDVLDYLNKHSLDIFNYNFKDKYDVLEVDVDYDETVQMFYVLYNGKRMYFSSKFETKESVIKYYRFILEEQDEQSPHRYLIDKMQVNKGDIVVDAGTAEGNFALDIIDVAAKVYLIEMDPDWVKALNQTFKDYQDKVVIISKCLSDIDDENNATLDHLFEDVDIDFLKMDIEGFEVKALNGAKKFLSKVNPIKLDICTYHNYNDYYDIQALLTEHNYYIEPSKGYMFYQNEAKYTDNEPHLVKGLIRGYKDNIF